MTTATATDVEQLAQRYAAAWNHHDLDEIMSMHAEDGVFHLNIGTEAEEARGAAAIRAAFAVIFAAFPDLAAETRRLYAREDLFVHEVVFSGTLAQPFPVGGVVLEPNGKRVEFNGVDVIPLENGLVKRKDTYLDAAAILQQFDLLGA